MNKIQALLRRTYPGSELILETLPSGLIWGWVVWQGFDGDNAEDRQDALWDTLKRELAPEENSVGMLFLQTPEERRELAAA